MAVLTLALDLVIAVLLVATIVYAYILNRRLGVLRGDKSELINLIARFNEATIRAEGSLHKLRAAAADTGKMLQQEMSKAQTLMDDLSYMAKRGGDLADRLESEVQRARAVASARAEKATPAVRPGRAATALGDRFAGATRSETERELLRALEASR